MITYSCPKCGVEMTSPDSLAGEQEKCPSCGVAIVVPSPVHVATATAEPNGSAGSGSHVPPNTSSGEKTCPYCGEQIKAIAIVCRFCRMNLQTRTPTKIQPPVVPTVRQPDSVTEPAQIIWSGKPSHIVYLEIYVFGAMLVLLGSSSLISLIFQRSMEQINSSAKPFFTNGPCVTWLIFPVGLLIVAWAALDCACTRYCLTSDKVTCRKGIIGRRFSEVDLKDIKNIVLQYGVLERLFGIGTLGIATSTARTFEVRFRGIREPNRIKELISQTKEQCLP